MDENYLIRITERKETVMSIGWFVLKSQLSEYKNQNGSANLKVSGFCKWRSEKKKAGFYSPDSYGRKHRHKAETFFSFLSSFQELERALLLISPSNLIKRFFYIYSRRHLSFPTFWWVMRNVQWWKLGAISVFFCLFKIIIKVYGQSLVAHNCLACWHSLRSGVFLWIKPEF